MKMNKVYSRWVVTIVASIILLCLYIVIFSFSAQDGEQSGGLSYGISEKCIDVVDFISGKRLTTLLRRELAESFEHLIRKGAHFTEYTCMGILVYVIWRQWMNRSKMLYCLVGIWVFLSAIGDEIHQLFVPGRYGSPADVLLDTCGGIFGIVVCVVLERYFSIKHKEKPA